MRLDRIDRALLAALQKDARASNKELAAKVGLAPSSTLGRVRRLVAEGVLLGAHADVLPAALGIGLQAMVVVRLDHHKDNTFDTFARHLETVPGVVASYHVGGVDDFLVHVAVRDADHLRDLLAQHVTSRPEVGRVRTEIVFEHHRRAVLPDYSGD
ncbi:MAG: Lrp/AsnC family transcriptional regulator [Myxococcota bacterium]